MSSSDTKLENLLFLLLELEVPTVESGCGSVERVGRGWGSRGSVERVGRGWGSRDSVGRGWGSSGSVERVGRG